jgi:hypothetical protein
MHLLAVADFMTNRVFTALMRIKSHDTEEEQLINFYISTSLQNNSRSMQATSFREN